MCVQYTYMIVSLCSHTHEGAGNLCNHEYRGQRKVWCLSLLIAHRFCVCVCVLHVYAYICLFIYLSIYFTYGFARHTRVMATLTSIPEH